MPDLSVPWGESELNISLPDRWKLQQVVRSSLRPAGDDWATHMARAISHPGVGKPLGKLLQARRNGRIVLVVEDITRHSPLAEILEVVMREVSHAGVPDENVEIFFATGMHPAMTSDQAAEKLGRFAGLYRWRCNAWHDPSAYASVGRTGKLNVRIDRAVLEADLRILISSVSPHLQAGFGGGHKMLVPGCAHLETIRMLHRMGVPRVPRQLAGTGAADNPMRSAIDAAGKLIDETSGMSFAIQYLLDGSNRPAFTAAGEVIPTQRMLAKQCAVACGIIVSEKADVLIVNAHPRDFDLWQSFKCIANTCWAARPKGVVICLGRCPAGLNGIKAPRWPVKAAWYRRIVRWLGADALASLLIRLMPGSLAGDAAFFVRMGLQTIQRNPIFIVSPALHEEAPQFPGLEIFPSVDQAVAAAEALLGTGPQRVVVFPDGGITYPVLTAAPGAAKGAT